MHRGFARLAAAAVLLTGASLAFAFSTGPPASRTGATAIGGLPAESDCTLCHGSFTLNEPGATLEILGVPVHYEPGVTYVLKVRMASAFPLPRRWGFEITAVREANGQGAGTFDVTGVSGIQVVNGIGTFASRRYVEHNFEGTYDEDPGPVEWKFRWRAPDTDLGRIAFFCAGNAANSNNTTSGDHIYTARATTEFASPLRALDAAHPNPFTDVTTLSFVLSAGGPVDLAVYDPQGRRLRTLASGDRPAGRTSVTWDGRHDDGTSAGSGVYYARLLAPGAREHLIRRITLIR
ncbi:MAG TPA: choice-of-anchor V domain-containing protein [Candidatus Eisenbacteria bacterium]|nr:choice-of-anchor V domain-containing protein [Candidatus Eisenbacteria bacterium]